MMMTVKQNCALANFHVKAVVRYIYPTYAVYDVVYNCGSSRFIPKNGDKLPKMVLDFMAEHQSSTLILSIWGGYNASCILYK